MIDRVVDSISPVSEHTLQIITQESLGKETGGAVETILNAEITKDPLLIANCDQLVKIDINKFINTDLDGNLAIFKSQNPAHSYVKVKKGIITGIKEKEVISPHAVSGVYFFKDGLKFKKIAKKIVADGIKYNDEFYVSSVIKEMVEQGFKLGVQNCLTAVLGTPEDLQRFEVAVEIWQSL